jgi:hypothetical protein
MNNYVELLENAIQLACGTGAFTKQGTDLRRGRLDGGTAQLADAAAEPPHL